MVILEKFLPSRRFSTAVTVDPVFPIHVLPTLRTNRKFIKAVDQISTVDFCDWLYLSEGDSSPNF